MTELKTVDLNDISKINIENDEPKKPYVVYLPENEIKAVEEKKNQRISSYIIFGMLLICIVVLGIGHYIEKKDFR